MDSMFFHQMWLKTHLKRIYGDLDFIGFPKYENLQFWSADRNARLLVSLFEKQNSLTGFKNQALTLCQLSQ
jgi:hypothetical protein